MLFILLVTVVLMGLGLRLYDLTAAVSVVITVADVLVGAVFVAHSCSCLCWFWRRAFPSTVNKQKSERLAGNRLTNENWAESQREISLTPTTGKTDRH